MKRLLTGALAFAMVLTLAGTVAAPASAATAADIQAMIASLQQQLAALNGGTTASTGYQFNTDLTIGSTGPDVTALQNWLISKGESIPAGATGYFGNETQAAVAAWQQSAGISPAVGYFGPISRAAVNGMAGSTTTTTTTTSGVAGCAAGAMFSSTTGAACGTTTTTTSTTAAQGITTIGKEGILTVSLGATPVPSNIYAGDHNDGILGIQIQAQQSDIDIQRVTLDLGSDTRIFNKIFSTFYVVSDTGQVLATLPLSLDSVTKSGSVYYATLTGFHYVVPAGTTHTLAINADLYPSIDSSITGVTTFYVGVDANGVRGVDGAGIDVYGPNAGSSVGSGGNDTVMRGAIPSASLADNATLQVSTDSATPVSNAVVATGGASNNQYDQFPFLTFDLFAQKDNIQLTDMVMTFKKTGTGGATTTTAYLYDGSTLIGSAAINSTTGVAQFNNMSEFINNNTTKVLTVKADIRSANANSATISAAITGGNYSVGVSGLATLNSEGNTITSTGSATSNNFVVRSVGPVLTLVGTPTIMKSATAGGTNGTATSTATASFSLQIQALGSNLYFGTQAASTTFGFSTYVGGAAQPIAGVASTTSWTIPSTGVITVGMPAPSIAFELQQNNTVTIPVTFYFEGRTSAGALISGNTYAVQMTGLNWSTTGNDTQSTTFMSALTGWQTSSVQMP